MATMPEPTPNALGQPEAPTPVIGAPQQVAPLAAPTPTTNTTNADPAQLFVPDGHKVKDVKPSYSKPGDEMLFGPTQRPNDLMNKVRPTKFVKQPAGLEQYMPAFTEAARQPDAPKELLEFMRILNFHMGRI